MKRVLVSLSVIMFMVGCKSGGDSPQWEPKYMEWHEIVAARINTDSSRTLKSLWRKFDKGVRYDSSQHKDIIFKDTIYAENREVDVLDSLGKVMVDSLGNPRKSTLQFFVPKDSVNWRVEGKSIAELTRRQ